MGKIDDAAEKVKDATDKTAEAAKDVAKHAGEQLPSVRQMAEDLVINPNTVARAYRDLEQEEIIELRHGSNRSLALRFPQLAKSIRRPPGLFQRQASIEVRQVVRLFNPE